MITQLNTIDDTSPFIPAVPDSPYVSPAPAIPDFMPDPSTLLGVDLTPKVPLQPVYVSPLEPVPFAVDPYDLRQAPESAPAVPQTLSNVTAERLLPAMPQPAMPDTPPPAPTRDQTAQAASTLLPLSTGSQLMPTPAPAAPAAAASVAAAHATRTKWLIVVLLVAIAGFVYVGHRRG